MCSRISRLGAEEKACVHEYPDSVPRRRHVFTNIPTRCRCFTAAEEGGHACPNIAGLTVCMEWARVSLCDIVRVSLCDIAVEAAGPPPRPHALALMQKADVQTKERSFDILLRCIADSSDDRGEAARQQGLSSKV
jgi:hypothetical protein